MNYKNIKQDYIQKYCAKEGQSTSARGGSCEGIAFCFADSGQRQRRHSGLV